MAGDVHTVPDGDGWINKSGGEQIGGRHETKDAAVKAGRAAAEERSSEHVIHNQDGQIAEKDSHGSDPRSIPG
jgi:hypothetical protein